MSNSSCLKIVQNLLGALYTLIHLAYFPYTMSVIPLYSDTNFISLVICQCMCINHVFNGLVEKIVDNLWSIVFLKYHYWGKYLKVK